MMHAQNRYWTQQFGAHASLTGGTAVSDVQDNSCFYYNPGAAAFLDSPRINISANLYGFEYINMKNGAGNGINLRGLRFNVYPQIVAGCVPVKKVPNLKIIYGTLTRFRTNIRFNHELRSMYDVIPASAGDEYYKARIEYQYSGIEQWGGLGVAYKVDEIFSAGLTAFAAYTNIETRATENLNADAFYNNQPYTATINEFNSMRLDQVNLIFKIGTTVNLPHLKLGLAVSMPGIKVWGQGRLDKSFESHNLNLNATDTTQPALKYASLTLSDEQSKLKTDYRHPASFAFGAKLVYPKFKLSVALEYFFGYKNVKIITGQDRAFIRPTAAYGGDTIRGFMTLTSSAASVVNIGLGAEYNISRKVDLLLGVRTDFDNRVNYLPATDIIEVESFRLPVWHYLHFSAGAAYRFSTHQMNAGFEYGLGISADKKQVFNLSEPQQNLLLRGELNYNMSARVHSLSFIIGYTYYFKSKYVDYSFKK